MLGADDRIKQVQPSGSIASDTADEWSDLDLEVITHADHHAAVVEDWPNWLAAITPTVFARTPIAPFIVNAVTDDGLTVDIAIFAGEKPDFAQFDQPGYAVGQLTSKRFIEIGDALEYAVAEQLRGMAGPLISLVQREEHMRHLAGVPHLLGLLTTVFLAETQAPPPGKHWNRTFTEEQRATTAMIPPAGANKEDILAFGMGVAELVLTRARPLYPRYNLTWPSELCATVANRVDDQLQIDTRAWCY